MGSIFGILLKKFFFVPENILQYYLLKVYSFVFDILVFNTQEMTFVYGVKSGVNFLSCPPLPPIETQLSQHNLGKSLFIPH